MKKWSKYLEEDRQSFVDEALKRGINGEDIDRWESFIDLDLENDEIDQKLKAAIIKTFKDVSLAIEDSTTIASGKKITPRQIDMSLDF